MIFVSEQYIRGIEWINIVKRIYLDHAPVCIQWQLFDRQSNGTLWHLNNLLLETDGMKAYVLAEIAGVLKNNNGSASEVVVWDTFKAYTIYEQCLYP